MLKFVVRRVLWTIPIILLVIFMTFWMMRAIKGSPFRKSERAVPPAVLANLNRKFGLNKPWYVQYERYVVDVAKFDLGPSLVLRNQNVNDIVREHFPVSAELGGFAMLLSILVGIPLGIISALRVNRWPDYIAQFISNLGFAIPSFFTATLLIYFFASKWRIFPTNGWDTPASKVLPVIALSLFPLTYFVRLVRHREHLRDPRNRPVLRDLGPGPRLLDGDGDHDPAVDPDHPREHVRRHHVRRPRSADARGAQLMVVNPEEVQFRREIVEREG